MKNYPAKLLLFGEHTVNAGSQALALPLPLFSGKWAYAPQLEPAKLAGLQMQLPQFCDYLDHLQQRGELLAKLDLAALRKAINKGLVFESNIPTGYGLGSSGALVAAAFENWKLGNWEIASFPLFELKKALAQMEAFFHGTSSGTDPLICLLQKPMLLGGPDGVGIVGTPHYSQPSYQFFLLDTGIRRQATPFINYFLEKMQDEVFNECCRLELMPAVEAAIAAFLGGNGDLVFHQVHQLGKFQLIYLDKMVPEKFRPILQQGLDGDLYKLKICGAGGGGFLLGITRDFEATKLALAAWKLLPVFDPDF